MSKAGRGRGLVAGIGVQLSEQALETLMARIRSEMEGVARQEDLAALTSKIAAQQELIQGLRAEVAELREAPAGAGAGAGAGRGARKTGAPERKRLYDARTFRLASPLTCGSLHIVVTGGYQQLMEYIATATVMLINQECPMLPTADGVLPTKTEIGILIFAFAALNQKVTRPVYERVVADDYQELRSQLAILLGGEGTKREITPLLNEVGRESRRLIMASIVRTLRKHFLSECTSKVEANELCDNLWMAHESNHDEDAFVPYCTAAFDFSANGTADFPGTELWNVFQEVAEHWQITESYGIRFCCFVTAIWKRLRCIEELRNGGLVFAAANADGRPCGMERDILPDMDNLLNWMKCPNRCPTLDSTIMQYQSENRYDPGFDARAHPEAPQRRRRARRPASSATVGVVDPATLPA